FFSSRRRHTRFSRDWSSDVCSSDLHTLDRHTPAGLHGSSHLCGHTSNLIHHLVNGFAGVMGVMSEITDFFCYDRKAASHTTGSRSEERRVGKECRSRWSPHHYNEQG